MASSKLAVGLLLLAMLTTTWARSIAEHGEKMVVRGVAERSDNAIERFSNGKSNRETIVAVDSEEDDDAYDGNFMRRYAKSEAEKIVREKTRAGGKARRSLHVNEDKLPFSTRRLEKMLEKAILKIITGDLNTADMLLLKSLNYSLEEVLAIRERELKKKNHLPEAPNVDTKLLYEKQINNDFIESSGNNRLENYDEKESKKEMMKSDTTVSSSSSSIEEKNANGDFDFDAYNRQAIYDYENASSKMPSRASDLDSNESSVDNDDRSKDNTADLDDDIHKSFDRAIEPHVVFKIRYDDSEFDSSSNEGAKQLSRERAGRVATSASKNNSLDSISSANKSSTPSDINGTLPNNGMKTFQTPNVPVPSSLPVIRRLDNLVQQKNSIEVGMETNQGNVIDSSVDNVPPSSTETSSIAVETPDSSTPKSDILENKNADQGESTINETTDEHGRKSIYEGLEWVEDDVYRVIPEAFDSLNYYDDAVTEMENGTIGDSTINETNSFEVGRRHDDRGENDNDRTGYQNTNPEEETQTETEIDDALMKNSPNVNLSTYQQLALAHRREGNNTSSFDSQGQKAIEDIKLKVLAMTGRFNLTSSGNQVQRERLTMFSPICQLPRNTDAEAWSDPFSMNMNFQLNLTSDDHVVAAKVRIYALPQNNITALTGGATEEEDEDEKKIRISIYFYTKSLKKHRSKKRLIDSVVISLTTQGSHWALDVRQALRFWRQNLRNSHSSSNNHGLVIQVEDQDGKLLKPSQYIQQDSCHTSELNEDEKAYQRVPALFVQACSRYVRVVNGAPVTYVNCRKNSRNGRH